MAIALDATSYTSTTVWISGSPVSWNHTCTGDNRILFVVAGQVGNCPGVQSVTYNSVGMTLVDRAQWSTQTDLTLWVLYAPATGTHTVSIICDVGTPYSWGSAVSYTGAYQSNTVDAHNSSMTHPDTGSKSITINVVASDCWIIAGGDNNSTSTGQTITCNTGLTSRVSMDTSNCYVSFECGDSNGTVATGNNSVGMTFTYGNAIGIVGASFAPAAASQLVAPVLMSQYHRRRS